MPISNVEPKFRRSPNKRKNKSVLSASKAIAQITSDMSSDWTVEDIAVEALARGMVPAEVLRNSQVTSTKKWIKDATHKIKIPTGKDQSKVRKYACYPMIDRNDHGDESVKYCYREWAVLNHWQQKKALKMLFENIRRATNEAEVTLNYVNQLRVEKKLQALNIDDFRSK